MFFPCGLWVAGPAGKMICQLWVFVVTGMQFTLYRLLKVGRYTERSSGIVGKVVVKGSRASRGDKFSVLFQVTCSSVCAGH